MGQIWQNSIPYSGAGSTDYLDLTTVLTAGSTSVTILNNAFKEDSVVDFFSDPYGIIPTNAVISPGLITITFKPQSQDVDILVRVYKEKGGGGAKYYSGKLINIDANNIINVRMEKSTDASIAQQSAQNTNTLFYTEGTGGSIYTTTAYLSQLDWQQNSGKWTQTIFVYGLTDAMNVIVSPQPASDDYYSTYFDCGIRATSITQNRLYFVALSLPSITIGINIAYWE